MSRLSQRFLITSPVARVAAPAPLIPIELERQGRRVGGTALLDTGSTVSVLPWGVGLALGFNWAAERMPIVLGGNLAAIPTRAVLAWCHIGSFAPVWMGFGWVQTDDPPLILGRSNFFTEFDVLFSISSGFVELTKV